MSTPMAVGPGEPLGLLERVVGWLCLRIALLVLRQDLHTGLAIVGRLGALASRPATTEEARSALLAVTDAGRGAPGRVACLELSLAAALLCAARRRRVRWCIGARMMPYAAHAWIETEGFVVTLDDAPDHPYLTLVHT